MSDHPITDEQLSAFALGELEGEERARVEAHLAQNESARQEVEQVRATAALLRDELSRQADVGLLDEQRGAIASKFNTPLRPPLRSAAGQPVRRTRWAMLALAAAACAAVASGTVFFLDRSYDDGRTAGSSNGTQVDTLVDGVWESVQGQSQQQGQQGLSARTGTAYDTHALAPAGGATADNGHVEWDKVLATGVVPSEAAPSAQSPAVSIRDNISSPQPRSVPAVQDAFEGVVYSEDAEAVGTRRPATQPFNTEAYQRIVDNPFLRVADNPLSTFSIDVDTASYSNIRRFLNQNALPPPDAVRIEELVNYFPYAYAPPEADGKAPFAAHVEVAGCPWNAKHRLVRIGLKGKEIASQSRPPSNLVFLVDVSGSMQPDNKLPLVKRGLRMLVEQLTENDRVSIVVYAGSTGLALPPTPGSEKGTLLGAIEALGAGGSTNGAGGITRAYETAVDNFIKGGVNRVVLCTDGDFNVGVTDHGSLTRLIEEKARTGVFLSVLGFGMGNLKDTTMETLADKGNGNYAYVDSLAEARKVLVEQMTGTLVTIAKDVKIQVEFNPAVASSYRLIGYENRVLAKEDFNDDTKDAGEIGAGHTVTALYEVVPAGGEAPAAGPKVDALKYQKPQPAATGSGELLTLKLRYKEPDGNQSGLVEFPVTDAGGSYAKASPDYKFAAAVAAFGMILRDSPHKGTATLPAVAELAQEGLGKDENGYRAEFLGLVHKAKALMDAMPR